MTGAGGNDNFATTRWTLVVAAGERSAPAAAMALEELCRIYWYPLYVYARRRGRTREDAEDLTQSFFARLLARNDFAGLAPERGRFRGFLLASFKNFLANDWDRSQRLKRGGGIATLSLDWQDAETRYQIEPVDLASPDKLFDRAWATTLLDCVISRLGDEYVAAGKAALFNELKSCLAYGKGAVSMASVAAALGIAEPTVRVLLHRLRHRFRDLLRDEISQTVDGADQVAEELNTLFAAFG